MRNITEAEIIEIKKLLSSETTDNLDTLTLKCIDYCYELGYSLIVGKSLNGKAIANVFCCKTRKAIFSSMLFYGEVDSVSTAVFLTTLKVKENCEN